MNFAELNPRVRCAFGNVFCTENVVDVPSVGTADLSGLGGSRKISRRPSVGHLWRKHLAFGDIYLTCRQGYLFDLTGAVGSYLSKVKNATHLQCVFLSCTVEALHHFAIDAETKHVRADLVDVRYRVRVHVHRPPRGACERHQHLVDVLETIRHILLHG